MCHWLLINLFVIKPGLFFVIYHKPLCYCNLEMQECFVINYGKWCLCDGCLWLITEVYDKSQKRPKLITKKCQKIPYSIALSARHSVINYGVWNAFTRSNDSDFEICYNFEHWISAGLRSDSDLFRLASAQKRNNYFTGSSLDLALSLQWLLLALDDISPG